MPFLYLKKLEVSSFLLRKITTVLILLLAYQNLSAQISNDINDQAMKATGGNIITAVPFLLISPDARASGMGGAGVASSPDINSQHWNASKFAFIDDDFGISLTYAPWLRALVRNVYLLYLAGYFRVDNNWVVGASMRFFSSGEVTFRRDRYDPPAVRLPHEYAFDVSLARRISDNFSLAITVRNVRSDLSSGFVDPLGETTISASSGAVDLSMFYTREIVRATRPTSFALGMNVSNIGTKIRYSDAMLNDFLPANLRLGGAFTTQIGSFSVITTLLDFNKLLVPMPSVPGDTVNPDPRELGIMQSVFRSFSDAPGRFREEIQISFGIEYVYNNIFAIRAGYFHEHQNKGGRQHFTAGAGLRLNVFEIDFAYLLPRPGNFTTAVDPLRNTMWFSFRVNFARRGNLQQAVQRPQVSPRHRALPCPPGQMRHNRSWDRPTSVFNHPTAR